MQSSRALGLRHRQNALTPYRAAGPPQGRRDGPRVARKAVKERWSEVVSRTSEAALIGSRRRDQSFRPCNIQNCAISKFICRLVQRYKSKNAGASLAAFALIAGHAFPRPLVRCGAACERAWRRARGRGGSGGRIRPEQPHVPQRHHTAAGAHAAALHQAGRAHEARGALSRRGRSVPRPFSLVHRFPD